MRRAGGRRARRKRSVFSGGEAARKPGQGRDALFGIGRRDAQIARGRSERADGIELGGVGTALADGAAKIGEGDGDCCGFHSRRLLADGAGKLWKGRLELGDPLGERGKPPPTTGEVTTA